MRDIKRRLDRLDTPRPADLPTVGLPTVFAIIDEESDVAAEWVDRGRQVMHVDGEPHYVPDVFLSAFNEVTER